jgi:exodeoxyribonuclease VII large subunit
MAKDSPNKLNDGSPIFSVAQLTDMLKMVVSETFSEVWVAGELSNCVGAGSGHWYLTLKDDEAQLRAVIWRNVAQKLRFTPEDGLAVIARGRIDIYAPRGTYQLVIEELQPRGVGAAELALRKLRDKLAAEGLFDSARKRPLPTFPRRIGIVTSPTGAAIRDFLEVLNRRWQGIDVLVLPARVQGEGSAAEIARAIQTANKLTPPLDALIIARGGGSSEDLWSFNEEVVVRAIAASAVPTISAIGHEIDVTLADLVADVRALTPSEAAERVVPSARDLQEQLAGLGQRFLSGLTWRAQNARRRLEMILHRPPFRRPFDRVLQHAQGLDSWFERARRSMAIQLQRGNQQLAARAAQLEALSPLQTLRRGYSVTTLAETGELVTNSSQVSPGALLKTRLAEGEVLSRVE